MIAVCGTFLNRKKFGKSPLPVSPDKKKKVLSPKSKNVNTKMLTKKLPTSRPLQLEDMSDEVVIQIFIDVFFILHLYLIKLNITCIY